MSGHGAHSSPLNGSHQAQKLKAACTFWETFGGVNHNRLGLFPSSLQGKRNTHTDASFKCVCGVRVCGAGRASSGSLLKFLSLIWNRN